LPEINKISGEVLKRIYKSYIYSEEGSDMDIEFIKDAGDFSINQKIIRDNYGNKFYELIDLDGRVWVFDYATGVSKFLEDLEPDNFPYRKDL
jgi:hypothetical protein